MMNKNLMIRLSETDTKKLDKIVSHYYSTKSNIIRMLINKEFKNLEEQEEYDDYSPYMF